MESEDVKHTPVTALNSDERNATQTADKVIHQTLSTVSQKWDYSDFQETVKTKKI